MREYKISFIVGVPNMYKKMFEQKNFEGKHLRNLELLFSGGDIVTEQFLDMFNSTIAKWGGKGRLFRGYGLTEVSSVCCANTYADFKRNSVGKPFYDMRVEIWDKDKKRLPANTVGEIAVSGSTLMEGYLNEPTSGVYTDDSGVRWVLTGDLGYIDEDGFLFFTGRKKRLIIISGYNVYPSDIEEKVIGVAGITEACAVQGYIEAKPIVKLYVALDSEPENKKKKIEEINEFCSENQPRFSRPTKIIILDALPRYPAEVDVSIRKGWFYHLNEDYEVKPLSKLMEIYYNSVGANASLLLNIPPNKDGLFAQRDVETLLAMGAQLQIDFNENLADDSVMTDSCRLNDEHCGQMALTHNADEYWHSGFDPDHATLTIDLGDDYDIDKIVLSEHIATGQQIEKFSLYAQINGKWKKIFAGTVIGSKRICRFEEMRVQYIKLVIEETRCFATISKFEAY